ncbi:TerB family tellurite resistance protein [Capilliphycus salinus ALCB114379]|uniref:tellurite resistance TerB family protein n=1 Tax=Capilliphycus salinus TaxID=2768948 RepID=UPI0039A59807
MPVFLGFLTQYIVPGLGIIFATIVPVMGHVLGFAVTRIPKIPSYITLIRILWKDTNPDSQARRYLNTALLILGGILSFMSYSLIPFTAIPIISTATVPIASVLSIIVALVSLDLVFNLNEGYYRKQLQSQENYRGVEDLFDDIEGLRKALGGSWKKVEKAIRDLSQKIDKEASQNQYLFDDFEAQVGHQIDGLLVFVNQKSIHKEIDSNQLRQVATNSLDSWLQDLGNVSVGLLAGGAAGLGTATAASSVFVQASMWTSIHSLFGLSTGGIVVSASTYGLLTLAAPVGVGAIVTMGIWDGVSRLKRQQESEKFSVFLADIILCSIPMAWSDGYLHLEEKKVIQHLLVSQGIQEKDRQRVLEALEKEVSFDEIFKTNALFDEEYRQKNCKQSEAEQLKHRLLLCTAWRIAIADDIILPEEIELHNHMADVLGFSQRDLEEIRRVVELSAARPVYQVNYDQFNQKSLTDVQKRYLPAAA